MKEWLTAAEIAEARLPGCAHTKRGVNLMASKEGWREAVAADGAPLCRPRAGGGGGSEFHVSLLPAAARTRLEARAGKSRPAPESSRPGEVVSAKALSRRDARLFVVARADDYRRMHPHLSKREADATYAAVYNAGSAEVPEWVRGLVKGLSRPSLERWRQFRDAARLDLVAGRHGEREGAQAIERLHSGEAATFIGALIVKQPMLNAAHIRTIVHGRFGGDIRELPSERSFRRFIAEWKDKNALALRKLTDPDGFKSSMRFSGSNSNAHVRALNQLWEIDASPADVMTTDGRHSIYVAIDIFSRRMMTFVTKTPRTEATLLLIRRAILAWGVPQTIKTDNGSDFTSRRFVSAMNSIGIEHQTSAPFSPEQKGTVERAIGSLQRDLMTLLDGFIGHSVADRKRIESRKAFSVRLGEERDVLFDVSISAADLQARCDLWCDKHYQHQPHKGLDGQTPFVKAASFNGKIARIENERALDLLLQEVGERQATKQGLRYENGWYVSPQLFAGTRVFCRQDPEDMGRLHCFDIETGAFLTTAVCAERAGLDPKAVSKATSEGQAAAIAAETQKWRSEVRKIKRGQIADWAKQSWDLNTPGVLPFPPQSTVHESEALSAAAEAVADPADLLSEIVIRPETSLDTNVVRLPTTPNQRFARAHALQMAMKAGEPVSNEDAMWLGGYVTTSEYRSFQVLAEAWSIEDALGKK